MKIAHIIPHLKTGGAEKLVLDSLLLYEENFIEVELIVLQKVDTIFSINLKGNVIYLSNHTPYNPFNVFKIAKILKNYDIVHIHLFPTLYWGILAKIISFSKTKIVYTEHSTSNRRRNNIFFKICDRFIYSKLDYIGCISKACYNNLVQHLDYKKKNICVIENGINLEIFMKDLSQVNYDFFDKDDFVLIQVSSFREQKDQKTVIKAMPLLPDRIKLLLVGDGMLRKECEQLATELGLSHRIKFLGNRCDIPQLFKYADLAIQSSNYEGFGLVSVEAMAVGKAVIVSDVEGLNDVVRGSGILFTKGDQNLLANEILKFYNNFNYKEKIEFQCSERAKDFDIRNMVSKYISMYKSIIR